MAGRTRDGGPARRRSQVHASRKPDMPVRSSPEPDTPRSAAQIASAPDVHADPERLRAALERLEGELRRTARTLDAFAARLDDAGD